jgi:hypothetical protein
MTSFGGEVRSSAPRKILRHIKDPLAGVISGLSPVTEKDGEELWTAYVPDGTTDIIIIKDPLRSDRDTDRQNSMAISHPFLLALLLGVCCNQSRELVDESGIIRTQGAQYIRKWLQLHGMLCMIPPITVTVSHSRN